MSCGYNINGVKNLLVTDYSNVAMKDYDAQVSSAIAVNTKNIEFEGSSELDNTYAFGKKLTVTINGLTIPTLNGKRLILEDERGSFFLIEEEFNSSITWRFTLDKQDEATVWDIEIPSNLQIRPCTVASVDRSALSTCGYDSTFKPYVMTSPKAATLIDIDNGLYLAEYKDRLDGEVTLTVSWDGVKFENRLQIVLPLNDDSIEFSDRIQRFVLYRHTFAVKSYLGWYVAGYEHGAEVQVDIATSDTENNGSLTLTLTEICDSPCTFFDSLSFMGGEELFYDYVKYAQDGTAGFVCSHDGEAMYILQRGYYQDGTASNLYKAKDGYSDRFPNLTLTGVFYSTKMFSNPDCYGTDTLSTTFPSNISINYGGRSIVGSVYSENSAWRVTYQPRFVIVTPDNGIAGSATSVTISSSSEARGTTDKIVISNGNSTIYLTVSESANSMNITPSTHDATSYTIDITSTGSEPTLVSSPSDAATKKVGTGHWTAEITANTDTSDRTFYWRFTQGLSTLNLSSTQSGCMEQWKPTGSYICDNGNSYEKEARFISLDGENWSPTDETRKGNLIEQGAQYCSV